MGVRRQREDKQKDEELAGGMANRDGGREGWQGTVGWLCRQTLS